MTSNLDSAEFRNALGSFATGVTIVTTVDKDGRLFGVTANSFNSVSLDPPMVLWSLAHKSKSIEAFRNASHFAVHILAADQEPLSNRFGKSSGDKFAGVVIEYGEAGIPLISGCSARFQCRTAYQYEGGDHIIFVGEVVAFARSERAPLLFHGGRYALAARKSEVFSARSSAEQPPGSFGEDFVGYLLGRAHFQLYGRMKSVIAAHDLDASDHFVLSVLGLSDGRTVSEINGIIGYTGTRASPEQVELLELRGLLRTSSDNSGRYWLSGHGRQTLIELTAAAKAVEEDALTLLDDNEVALLKHLLKHVIRASDPGLPDPWHAEHEPTPP